MTHAQHTPGPWRIVGQSDFLDVAYSSGRICMMECEDDQQTHGETEANARLIAAAPELLAALETAYNQLATWIDNDAWDADDERSLELIGAAIAKAKGE